MRIRFYPAKLDETAFDMLEDLTSKRRDQAPRLIEWIEQTLSAEIWRRGQAGCPVEPFRPILPLHEWQPADVAGALHVLSACELLTWKPGPLREFLGAIHHLVCFYAAHLLRKQAGRALERITTA
jgi:hypothetical protein